MCHVVFLNHILPVLRPSMAERKRKSSKSELMSVTGHAPNWPQRKAMPCSGLILMRLKIFTHALRVLQE